MRKWSVLSLMIILVALAGPAPAQNTATNSAPCDLAGTWYGTGAMPYFWTISRSSAGQYAGVCQLTIGDTELGAVGYVAVTPWFSTILRTPEGTWEQFGILYARYTEEGAAAAGASKDLPELDIVHSNMELIDCNTMRSTIDVYGWYVDFTPETKQPFVTPVDVNAFEKPGDTIVEMYWRMPTACNECGKTGPAGPPREPKDVRLPAAKLKLQR